MGSLHQSFVMRLLIYYVEIEQSNPEKKYESISGWIIAIIFMLLLVLGFTLTRYLYKKRSP